MISLLELIAVVGLAFGVSTVVILLTVNAHFARNRRFIEHLEHRIIVLHREEFGRQLLQEQEKWRRDFNEAPPPSLTDEVRTRLQFFPSFAECERDWQAVLDKARR